MVTDSVRIGDALESAAAHRGQNIFMDTGSRAVLDTELIPLEPVCGARIFPSRLAQRALNDNPGYLAVLIAIYKLISIHSKDGWSPVTKERYRVHNASQCTLHTGITTRSCCHPWHNELDPKIYPNRWYLVQTPPPPCQAPIGAFGFLPCDEFARILRECIPLVVWQDALHLSKEPRATLDDVRELLSLQDIPEFLRLYHRVLAYYLLNFTNADFYNVLMERCAQSPRCFCSDYRDEQVVFRNDDIVHGPVTKAIDGDIQVTVVAPQVRWSPT